MKLLLSDAILRGIEKYPLQCKGAFFRTPNKACVLGAGLAGSEYKEREMPLTKIVTETWPYLLRTVPIPCELTSELAQTALLVDIVIALNDSYGWTREDIACYVRTVEREFGLIPEEKIGSEGEVEDEEALVASHS